jgi:hypothetical protein
VEADAPADWPLKNHSKKCELPALFNQENNAFFNARKWSKTLKSPEKTTSDSPGEARSEASGSFFQKFSLFFEH